MYVNCICWQQTWAFSWLKTMKHLCHWCCIDGIGFAIWLMLMLKVPDGLSRDKNWAARHLLILYIDYTYECIYTIGNDKIFTLSALDSMVTANAESVGCQSALDMYPAFPQMTRNKLPDIYSNSIYWLHIWVYLYDWEWWNIYTVSMASMVSALGSTVNADWL